MKCNEELAKAVYGRPQLSVFGAFSELTASGSAGRTEFAGQGMTRIRP